MIRTQIIEKGKKFEIDFVVPSAPNGGQVCVVGDFNGWDPTVTPLAPREEGYAATVRVEPGRYAFRYLCDDGSWFNDEAAHTYEPSPFGSDNGVLDLTDAVPAKKPRAPRKKPASTT